MGEKEIMGCKGAFSIRIDDIMLDCDDAVRLGEFYAGLLGWTCTKFNDDCVMVKAEDHPVRLLCQREEGYVPPVWPEVTGAQQKMLHLDFTVDNLENAVAQAVHLGAKIAETQYNPRQWTTMLDPAGHPFCLCLPE